MGERPQRVCVVCGEDCSSRPRTKDVQNNYYCTPCYERRRAETLRSQPPATTPRIHPLPTPMPGSAPAPAEDIFAVNPDWIASELAAAPETVACQSCGSSMPEGGVVCMNCGHNQFSGAQLQTQMLRAAVDRRASWPIVIGVISIVFGIGGVVLQGAALAANASGTTTGVPRNIISAIFAAMLAIWLAFAGFKIMRRDPSGVDSIRKWAKVKLVLVGIALTCLGIGFFAVASMKNQLSTQFGVTDVGALFAILLAFLAWAAAWPIFVLVWFNRPAVGAEVRSW